MTETTPGYAIALAAAELEAREQYIHKLAAELTQTAELIGHVETQEGADRG